MSNAVAARFLFASHFPFLPQCFRRDYPLYFSSTCLFIHCSSGYAALALMGRVGAANRPFRFVMKFPHLEELGLPVRWTRAAPAPVSLLVSFRVPSSLTLP